MGADHRFQGGSLNVFVAESEGFQQQIKERRYGARLAVHSLGIGKGMAVDVVVVARDDPTGRPARHCQNDGAHQGDPLRFCIRRKWLDRFDEQSETLLIVEGVEPLLEQDVVVHLMHRGEESDQALHHIRSNCSRRKNSFENIIRG